MVDLEPLVESDDVVVVKELIKKHRDLTGSTVAKNILDNWGAYQPKFVKVFPREFRRAMKEAVEKKKGAAKSEVLA